MTDTSKYTGTHKERFDENGKGKSTEEHKDIADTGQDLTEKKKKWKFFWQKK